MFARLLEPHFPKDASLLLSDQPTFQRKVLKGERARTRGDIGSRLLSCVPQNGSPGRLVGSSPGLEPEVRGGRLREEECSISNVS